MNDFDDKIKASPAAKRVARELGIDISKLEGTGIDGRIQLSDVEAYGTKMNELTENTAINDIVTNTFEAKPEKSKPESAVPSEAPVIAGCDVYADTIAKALAEEDAQGEKLSQPQSSGYSIKMYETQQEEEPSDEDADATGTIGAVSTDNNTDMKSEKFSYDPGVFGIYEEPEEKSQTLDDELEENVIEKIEKKENAASQENSEDKNISDLPNAFAFSENNSKEEPAEPKDGEEDNKQEPAMFVPADKGFGLWSVSSDTEEKSEESEAEAEDEDEAEDGKPSFADETEEDDKEDEEECSCCHHHHEEDDECDCDEYDEEQCEPLRIDFEVDEEPLRAEFEKLGVLFEQGLTDAVVKAFALAIYDADDTYDGIMNYVKITRDDIEVRTVTNALEASIGDISYNEPYDYEDVFINIWDMTAFGFSSMARPDKDSINAFIMRKNGKILISTVSDEYIVDIMTCCAMMDDFRLNLEKPSAALSRKEYPDTGEFDDEEDEDSEE